MEDKGNTNDFWDRLTMKMKEYSDDEIISILEKLRLYEPQAQKIAIEEAIHRGIINSEQDLFSNRVTTEPPNFTLFPSPDKPETILKIARSISRALLVAGAIPVIFGVLRFQVYKFAEGSALMVAGLIWISSAWLLFSKQERRLWSPMVIIALFSAIYVSRILFLLKGLRTMDYIIPAILFAVIFYCLFYLRSLLVKLDRNKKTRK
jgi:hypothetical protein